MQFPDDSNRPTEPAQNYPAARPGQRNPPPYDPNITWPGTDANISSQSPPFLPNPYTMGKPYNPPLPPAPRRGWIKWALLLMVAIVLAGIVLGVSWYLNWTAQNRHSINRAWTYCRDIQNHQSNLGLVLTNDLSNATMTPEQLKTAITKLNNGWIADCLAFGEVQQGDHATVKLTFTFANKQQVTHQYTLVRIIEDNPWSRKNNWRIDAQDWNGTF